MKYPAYPRYKDSGVEWLREIPEGWDALRGKLLFSLIISKSLTSDFRIALEHIESGSGCLIDLDAVYETDGVYFEAGDVLFGKLRPYLAKVWVADRTGEAVGDFFVLRTTHKILAFFLKYMLLSDSFLKQADGSTFGAKMPRVSWDFMANFRIPLPPAPTQLRITTFLDTETAKIDGLIKDYEELIVLLQEKRQALISHAVTRGLSELVSPDDPEFGEWAKPVKFKDSGVEWLGEIPEDWEVTTIRYHFSIGRGRVISQEELVDDGLYPVYSSQTLNDGCLGYINTYDFDCEQITWTTDGANAGTIFIRSGRHNCTNVCGTLQLITSSLNLRYIYYLLSIGTEYYKRPDTNGAKIMNNEMACIKILRLSLKEQKAIVSYLDKILPNHLSLITETESAISLLKEHRSALITNAVTGKINVEALV